MNTAELIGKKELAKRLSVSERSIDNYVNRGWIPFVKIGEGGSVRFEADRVIEALRKRFGVEAGNVSSGYANDTQIDRPKGGLAEALKSEKEKA